jgi:hypothetical protein
MTLGVLSLVLILAMSFSFTARTELHLAQNNADMVRTRLLARSALNEAIGIMTWRFDKGQTPGAERLFPGTIPFASNGLFGQEPLFNNQYVWLSYGPGTIDREGLEAAYGLDFRPDIGASPAFLQSPTTWTGLINTKASWLHVTGPEPWHDDDGDGNPDTGEYTDLNGNGVWDNGMLVGRLAYILVDQSGKIDPNAAMTTNQEPKWVDADGATQYYDINSDGSWANTGLPEFSTAVPRPGLSPQEILLQYYTQPFYADLPTSTTPSLGTRQAEWFSWHQIYNDDNIVKSAWNTDGQATLHSYFPYSHDDMEAFRYPRGAANENDYHRLDLWAVKWGNGTGNGWGQNDSTTGLARCLWLCCYRQTPGSAGVGNADPILFTDTANVDPGTSIHGGAPALAGFTNKDVTKRVLLNLADFCDPLDQASYWPDNANHWDLSAVGNEAVPYVNEVAFSAMYLKDFGADGVDGTDDDTGTFTLEPYVELAQIYPDAAAASFNAKLRLTFKLTNQSGALASHADVVISTTGSTGASRGYTILTPSTWTAAYSGATTPTKVTIEISKCEVVLDDSSSGALLDYARPVDSTSSKLEAKDIDGDPTATMVDIRYASVQADDPRCNTLPEDWPQRADFGTSKSVITMVFTGTPPVPTGGATNNAVAGGTVDASSASGASGYACDLETTGDPTTGTPLSTAYIANRPNITFWELGAVCRGEAWRTINLRAYPNNPTALRGYSDGDAVLLDQLNMGGPLETRGKVNANSPETTVWQHLTAHIRVKQAYDKIDTSSGSELTYGSVQLQSAANTIATELATNGAMESRGKLVDRAPGLFDGSFGVAQETDREQEEIIGKLANLLTVRPNLFTVLVTAQSVKDFGTTNAPGSIMYDTTAGAQRYCRRLSEQRVLATLYRDAFTNKCRVVRMEYLEN